MKNKGKKTSNDLQNTTKKTKYKLYIQPAQGRRVTPGAPDGKQFLLN